MKLPDELFGIYGTVFKAIIRLAFVGNDTSHYFNYVQCTFQISVSANSQLSVLFIDSLSRNWHSTKLLFGFRYDSTDIMHTIHYKNLYHVHRKLESPSFNAYYWHSSLKCRWPCIYWELLHSFSCYTRYFVSCCIHVYWGQLM